MAQVSVAEAIAHLLKHDFTCMRPDEGALTIAATAKSVGLNPCKLLMGPVDFKNVQISLQYLHEYIDEEQSYLVFRTPERFLLGIDTARTEGRCLLVCRSPDVEVELRLCW